MGREGAQRWAEHLPYEYEALTDPEVFFTQLGEALVRSSRAGRDRTSSGSDGAVATKASMAARASGPRPRWSGDRHLGRFKHGVVATVSIGGAAARELVIFDGSVMTAPRIYTRLAAIGVVVTAVLVASSSGVLPDRVSLILDDGAQLVAAVFASVCCAITARWVGGVERTWRRLMAIGMAAWSLGQLLWSWYEIVDHRLLPSPSPADIGFLTLPVFAVPALLVIAVDARHRRSGRTRSVAPAWLVLLLDGLIVVGSLLILSWVTTLGPVVSTGAPTALAFAVAVAYPVTDLLLVVMVLLLLSTQPAPLRLRPQLVLLGFGLAGLAVSDSILAHLVAGGAQSMPPISNAGFIAGPLLIGLAALTTSPPGRTASRADRQRARRARPPSVAWAHLLLPYLPLAVTGAVMIILQVTGQEHQAVEIYLGFPVVTLVIIRQMITLVDNAALLGQVTRAQRRLRHQAFHDPLTGLANRTLFQTRLTNAIAATPTGQARRLALYFIDLDDFKDINDALGHVIGDRVLKEVARRIRSAVRDNDLVARLGGDEFGVLITDKLIDPYDTGHRILDAVGQPLTVDAHDIAISASVGAVVADATCGLNSDQLLTHADRAMYTGKQHGKATLTLCTPSAPA